MTDSDATDAGTDTATDSASITGSNTDSNTDSSTDSSTDASTDSTTDGGTDTDSGDTEGLNCEVDENAAPECGDGVVAPAEYCPGDVLVAPGQYLGQWIRAGDINNDGFVDLFAGERLLINDQQGAVFQTSGAAWLTGVNPGRVIATGEFNGDGRTDVVYVRDSSDVRLLRGNDFGALWDAGTEPDIGIAVVSVTAGDFNGDGIDDVVTGGQLWYGVQDGDLSGPIVVADVVSPVQVASGDLNGDGKLDLVFSYSQAVYIYLAKPIGLGFEAPVVVQGVAHKASDLELVDIDGDGLLDLVISLHNNSIATLLGDGDGALVFDPVLAHPIEDLPGAVTVLDYNGDSRPDVAYIFKYGNITKVGLLLGEDNFDLFADGEISAPLRAVRLEAADFNGDGRDDLIVADDNVNGGRLLVYWGNDEAALDAYDTIPTGAPPSALATDDLNKDGNPDLLVGCAGTDPCRSEFLSNSDGWLATPWLETSDYGWDMTGSDFNLDGFLDFAVAQNDVLGVFLGNGVGGTDPELTYSIAGSHGVAIEAADFNGDDVDDLVVLSAERTPEVFASSGDGQFASASDVAPLGLNNPLFGDLAVGDFDGDGKNDVVAVYQDAATLYWHKGLGGYNLVAEPPPIPITEPATRIESADLNLDGALDVVLAMPTGNRIATLFGGGDGTFSDETLYTECPSVRNIRVADINLDGAPDLAASCLGGEGVVMINDGAGALALDHTFDLIYSSSSGVEIADMNNDCAPDVVFSAYDAQNEQNVGTFLSAP